MAETAGGHNLTTLKKDIAEAAKKINKFKADRSAANEEISAVRETLQAKGVKKESLDMAMKYMNWDEDKRRDFDFYYGLVREALGAPVQADLFDVLKSKPDEKAEAEKAAAEVSTDEPEEKPKVQKPKK